MTLYVAEIGSMHKGNPHLAHELIRQAAQAGATQIKVQLGWTAEAQDEAHHPYSPIRYVDHFAHLLAEWCEMYGVELMASIWSKEGLETARKVGMKRYKIAAQKSRDREFVGMILADGKETFISNTAPWTPITVRTLYCVSKYPVYPQDLDLPCNFGTGTSDYYGYSDHAHGIEPCLIAISRGARYVEKHVCLSKDDLCVKDTPFSATPDEFAELVRMGKGMQRWL